METLVILSLFFAFLAALITIVYFLVKFTKASIKRFEALQQNVIAIGEYIQSVNELILELKKNKSNE